MNQVWKWRPQVSEPKGLGKRDSVASPIRWEGSRQEPDGRERESEKKRRESEKRRRESEKRRRESEKRGRGSEKRGQGSEKRRSYAKRRRIEGFSLIEVLVASALLTAVLVPLLYLLSQTVRGTEFSLDEIRATNLAAELIEQLQILPFTAGYARLRPRPNPNPPPDFPFYHNLTDRADLLHVEGLLFGPIVQGQPDLFQVPTEGWKKIGKHYCEDFGPDPDPLVMERSRLFLSPMPTGFQRYCQTHNPMVDSYMQTYDPYLTKIRVRVEWQRQFQGSKVRNRLVRLTTLVGAPWRR